MVEKEMPVGVIAITTKEYKKLVEAQVRINLFADFVNKERYTIGRDDCSRYLGFELEDEEGE